MKFKSVHDTNSLKCLEEVIRTVDKFGDWNQWEQLFWKYSDQCRNKVGKVQGAVNYTGNKEFLFPREEQIAWCCGMKAKVTRNDMNMMS